MSTIQMQHSCLDSVWKEDCILFFSSPHTGAWPLCCMVSKAVPSSLDHLLVLFSQNPKYYGQIPGSKEGLDWKVRFKIALGIAQGLHYLHEGCQRRIIHRDIKASNILLTQEFQPLVLSCLFNSSIRSSSFLSILEQQEHVTDYDASLKLDRYLISGSRSGCLTNGITMWCSPSKAHLGETKLSH